MNGKWERPEVSKIYTYTSELGQGTIYGRVLSIAEDSFAVLCLKPTDWLRPKWSAGNIVNFPSKSWVWDLVDRVICLKCLKKNPCRSMELLCGKCRF